MNEPFTAEQITALSAEVDEQLQELNSIYGTDQLKGVKSKDALPDKQRQVIAVATGEDAASFLKRFKQAARQDLCEKDGVLYKQWKKWGDLSNKQVLKSFGAVLVAMGFAGNALQILAVALAVVVLHIGVKAICEEVET